MESFLIETPRWSDCIDISEGIVIHANKSLKWAVGKKEERLFSWLNKAIGSGKWKKIRQEVFEAF